MPHFFSATDVAIANAAKRGTLRLIERPSRFGDTFIAIEDEVGLIEVALSKREADARVASVMEAA
jgi:hypothetical protein